MSATDEYWINVYRGGRLGMRRHLLVEQCIIFGWIDGGIVYELPVYRLHVRLKRKIYNHPSR